MEVALVSAATGALKPVLEKLAALLDDKYERFKGVRKEIKSLAHELSAMDAFLMKMSEEEFPDEQDKVWMTEVRELSYDMEDCIVDFMQSVDDKDPKPEGFVEKIKHSLGKMMARRHIGDEIGDLKKRITEVSERNARYTAREAFSNTKNVTVDPRALVIFEHASKLVGIDEPKAEIIKMLTREDGCASTQGQLKVVSILGSGGMGKTTLANQVYQDLKGQFECRAFLSVSRNPDMMNILRTILSEFSGQRYADTETGSIQQLIIKINDFLAYKRYFIVVDDIWDVEAWDVIKSAFPITSSSTIITTTRMNNVADSCCSYFNGNIYKIVPLNMMHSRQLFYGRLFKLEENCPLYLEEISDQILKKCDGLPLAIIAISGLLANIERTEYLWNRVKESIGRALERNHSIGGMMKILSLSYFHLPPHLKSCLLYMSIFMEDSIIERKNLIRRWIGEGFIQKEDKYMVDEIGERCFNELLNRSLIQPVKTNEYGRVKTCRVHDMILDFIKSKSVEENFVTLVGVPLLTVGTQSKVIRRLSLQGVNQGNSTTETTGLVFSHVRSLNVFGDDSMKIPSLEKFKHLRVLHLEHYHQLEKHHLESIARLLQLRYLNLRSTRISELPEQIGRLGCLEMLDLRGTYIQELPASIVNLRKLSHLHVKCGVKFPDGIANMQALEILKQVKVSKQPVDFLWGLGQLKNLRKLVLHFQFDSITVDINMVREKCKKAIVSSLCKLGTQNLRSLTIWQGSSLLEEPLRLITLEKLSTRSSTVLQVPNWVSSLRNLQQLSLQVGGVKQDDFCVLGGLPTLVFLNLWERTESSERLRISGDVGFQSLRIFRYYANYQPVDLMFVAGSMPKLEKLEIINLHVFEAGSRQFGIENLPCLITVRCVAYGDDGIVGAVRTAMERATNINPNHPALLFERTDELGFPLID